MAVDREQLLDAILTADPQPGDLVYVERRGHSYGWHGGGECPPGAADTWIYYCWQHTVGDRETAREMLDDLLAEMESMIGSGADRCRWPLDEPWPRTH
ncbi:hypothetical protein ABZ942_12480 [Nocardia sp. NPDC046473]|uniref:hypothetical protein n=1 Tax=Nocardia sp. NPDC046473 TaxID=3155733 RepID=UPI00340806EF